MNIVAVFKITNQAFLTILGKVYFVRWKTETLRTEMKSKEKLLPQFRQNG